MRYFEKSAKFTVGEVHTRRSRTNRVGEVESRRSWKSAKFIGAVRLQLFFRIFWILGLLSPTTNRKVVVGVNHPPVNQTARNRIFIWFIFK